MFTALVASFIRLPFVGSLSFSAFAFVGWFLCEPYVGTAQPSWHWNASSFGSFVGSQEGGRSEVTARRQIFLFRCSLLFLHRVTAVRALSVRLKQRSHYFFPSGVVTRSSLYMLCSCAYLQSLESLSQKNVNCGMVNSRGIGVAFSKQLYLILSDTCKGEMFRLVESGAFGHGMQVPSDHFFRLCLREKCGNSVESSAQCLLSMEEVFRMCEGVADSQMLEDIRCTILVACCLHRNESTLGHAIR